jgi:hypothetical protein
MAVFAGWRHALVSRARSAQVRTGLLLTSLACVAFLGAAEGAAVQPPASSIASAGATTRLEARATPTELEARSQLARVRMPFIANHGQVDARVAYYAPTFAGTLFITQRGELVYVLAGSISSASRTTLGSSPRSGWSLTETLRGGKPRPFGKDRSVTSVSSFFGSDPAHWRPHVAT